MNFLDDSLFPENQQKLVINAARRASGCRLISRRTSR